MPDLSGQRAVVTGANSGVGFAATRLLAGAGAEVAMVCRSRERGEQARDRIPDGGHAELEIADLASLDSVRDLAKRLRTRGKIDILVNNAGVYRARRELTADGFEVTLGTNHLGHFLLTTLLLPSLINSRARIVNVASNAHRGGNLRRAPLEDLLHGRAGYMAFHAYSDSKLANVLFTFELDRRYRDRGIHANAVHPGVLATGMWNKNRDLLSRAIRLFKPLMSKPAVGGNAVFRILTDSSVRDLSGRYFDINKEARAAEQAYDEGLARELWETSEVRYPALSATCGRIAWQHRRFADVGPRYRSRHHPGPLLARASWSHLSLSSLTEGPAVVFLCRQHLRLLPSERAARRVLPALVAARASRRLKPPEYVHHHAGADACPIGRDRHCGELMDRAAGRADHRRGLGGRA